MIKKRDEKRERNTSVMFSISVVYREEKKEKREEKREKRREKEERREKREEREEI
jgi:hypothetical protein